MNVLDKLLEKQRQHAERLTPIERLILACNDPRLKMLAAAQWHELNTGKVFDNAEDLSELHSRQIS